MRYLIHLLMTPRKQDFDKRVEEILDKLEYRHLREYESKIEEFILNIFSRLEDWLESANIQQGEITNAASSISNVIIIIGTIVVLSIIILMFIYTKKIVGRNMKARNILGEIIDDKTTKEELGERARRYKKSGEYREALRYSFISLLFQMNEVNLLYLDEGQTNEEIACKLRENNFVNIELFESAVKLFNGVWYGHKKIGNETYEKWEKMMAVLENGVYGIEKK